MAQAALVRGQAQAQAAMMLNPRNIQAMAEHMGLRQPFNPVKHVGRRQGSNASTPTSHSPEEPENGKGVVYFVYISSLHYSFFHYLSFG